MDLTLGRLSSWDRGVRGVPRPHCIPLPALSLTSPMARGRGPTPPWAPEDSSRNLPRPRPPLPGIVRLFQRIPSLLHRGTEHLVSPAHRTARPALPALKWPDGVHALGWPPWPLRHASVLRTPGLPAFLSRARGPGTESSNMRAPNPGTDRRWCRGQRWRLDPRSRLPSSAMDNSGQA